MGKDVVGAIKVSYMLKVYVVMEYSIIFLNFRFEFLKIQTLVICYGHKTQESLNITKYARGAFGETPKCNVGILAGNASIGLGRQISLY